MNRNPYGGGSARGLVRVAVALVFLAILTTLWAVILH